MNDQEREEDLRVLRSSISPAPQAFAKWIIGVGVVAAATVAMLYLLRPTPCETLAEAVCRGEIRCKDKVEQGLTNEQGGDIQCEKLLSEAQAMKAKGLSSDEKFQDIRKRLQ